MPTQQINGRNSGWKTRVLPIVVPGILLIVWELSVRSGWWPSSLIAPPSSVFTEFWTMLLSFELLEHSLISFWRVLAGFFIGTILGLLVGVLVGTAKLFERLFGPTLQTLAPIPPPAWIPLLIILFGIGEASKIALVALGTFFVIFINTVQGIRSADQKLVEVAEMYQKDKITLIISILIPSALPSILTGTRVALALSWILLIASEVIASSKGLGWLMWDARNFSRPAEMLVGMVAVGILGKLSDMAVVWLEQRLLSWRLSFEGV